MSVKRKSVYEEDEEYGEKVSTTITVTLPSQRAKKLKTTNRTPKANSQLGRAKPQLSPVPSACRNPMFSTTQRAMIQDEDMRICYDHLCELMNHLQATPFNMPVDWEGLGLLDYPIKVPSPLDLGTIKQLLVSNALANPEHFAKHVEFVFKNAQAYNPPDSPIYKAACHLLKLFSERYNQLFEPGEMVEEEENVIELETFKKKIQVLNKSITDLKDSVEALRESRKKVQARRIRFSRPNVPLSYAEKEELCKLIPILNEEELRGLLDIIRPPKPEGYEGEVEIDIESVDDPTLVRAQRYLATCASVKASDSQLIRRSRNLTGSGDAKKAVETPTLPLKGRASRVKVGMILPVSPEDNYEGFWLGLIHAIPNNHTVVVQWFELRNRDCLHAFNKALATTDEIPKAQPVIEAENEKAGNAERIGDQKTSEIEDSSAEKIDEGSFPTADKPADLTDAGNKQEQSDQEGGEKPEIVSDEKGKEKAISSLNFHPQVLSDVSNPSIRWYEKTQNFDAIPIDTVYCVDLMEVLEFHSEVGLWKLPNALEVMESILQYDQQEEGIVAAEKSTTAAPSTAETNAMESSLTTSLTDIVARRSSDEVVIDTIMSHDEHEIGYMPTDVAPLPFPEEEMDVIMGTGEVAGVMEVEGTSYEAV